MPYTENQLLPISALEHLLFCERQCALIHIEQAWAENSLTAQGTLLHERAHAGGAESRGELRVSRSLRLRSLRLGLAGIADVVEWRRQGPGDEGALLAAIGRLDRLLDDVRRPGLSTDAVRGLEGDAAAAYFGVFDHLIVAQKDAFRFTTRSRRPPTDPVNALLSFLYTLLAHDATGALEAVGLDPQVGFLHAMRPGRPSLALDLLEELRPVVADRLALSLINLRQIGNGGFRYTESGGVEMNEDTRKALLMAYQKRKLDEIIHPFLGEAMPVGMLLHAQALLLARHLRGDLDAYPPFIWR